MSVAYEALTLRASAKSRSDRCDLCHQPAEIADSDLALAGCPAGRDE